MRVAQMEWQTTADLFASTRSEFIAFQDIYLEEMSFEKLITMLELQYPWHLIKGIEPWSASAMLFVGNIETKHGSRRFSWNMDYTDGVRQDYPQVANYDFRKLVAIGKLIPVDFRVAYANLLTFQSEELVRKALDAKAIVPFLYENSRTLREAAIQSLKD